MTREKTGEILDQAREGVKSRLSEQKEAAAAGIGSVAQAIRQAGDQLGREQPQIGAYAGRLAEMVNGVSGYLRERDLDQITGEVERFARRNPAVFIGGAFALGFVASRFLKSSATDGGQERRDLTSSAAGIDIGESTVTAGGTTWDGDPEPDSPRGRPLDSMGGEVPGSGSATYRE
jgi:hypothetical protein